MTNFKLKLRLGYHKIESLSIDELITLPSGTILYDDSDLKLYKFLKCSDNKIPLGSLPAHGTIYDTSLNRGTINKVSKVKSTDLVPDNIILTNFCTSTGKIIKNSTNYVVIPITSFPERLFLVNKNIINSLLHELNLKISNGIKYLRPLLETLQ